jgi:GNAT superfamily N-acetyltransferase
MDIRIAASDAEILSCYSVMVQLRPDVGMEEFLPRVRRQQTQGYRLAFLEAAGTPVTLAGYRFLEQLSSGRVLYVDDLATDASGRSAGHGSQMLAWLIQQAAEEGCAALHLDSGVQRKDAHRFYLREGMTLASYHFKISVAAG